MNSNSMDLNYSLVGRNIHQSIFKLAVPGMISSVMQTLYQLVDAYWVGKLGAASLAAIGGCSFIIWAIISLSALSVNGIMTLVSQNIGAGNPAEGRLAAGQGMVINTLSALIFACLVYLTQPYWYSIMGFTQEVRLEAFSYMNIILVGLIFTFWFMGLEGVFRGLGDTRTPMFILGIALIVNSLLDPVFIFGWFGLPELGIAGAALATIVAHALAVILATLFLRKKMYLPRIARTDRKSLDAMTINRILHIGSPIAFGGFFFSIIYVFLTNIISNFGTEAIAAIGICHRIEGIAWFACVGYSIAASTLVGQYVGAKKIVGARSSAWWVNVYGVVTLFVVSIIFFFWPETLIKIFTDNEAVQRIGIEYLRIIAVFEIFLALEVIMEGAFSGAGYTLPVMLVSVVFTAARVPLAWYLALSLEMGTRGVWIAIALTTFLKGALNTILFALDFWKKNILKTV